MHNYKIREELIKSIMTNKGIFADPFSIATIRKKIEHIDDSDLQDFFEKVISTKSFGEGLLTVIDIAEKYKTEKTELLLEGTRDQAKAMYDKFYAESCSMLDFTQKNRDEYPSDKEFFLSVKYDTLKRTDGTNSYTKQEMYVLNELGGGEWLRCIRLALNSNDLINQIEAIIKRAVVTKYGNQSNAIESKKVAELLRGGK